MAEASDRRISEFRIVDDAERQCVIEVWNQNKANFEGAATLHGLVQSQARRNPYSQALVSASGQITYDELDRWSDSLARKLCSAFDPHERPIAALLDRSFTLAASLLAIWKAGGILRSHRRTRTRAALADKKIVSELEPAAIIYCQTSKEVAMRIVQSLGNSSLSPVLLVSGEATHVECLAGAPGVTVAPNQLAYIVHTSGTTGRPKGVMVEHRALVNQIMDEFRFPLGRGDGFCL